MARVQCHWHIIFQFFLDVAEDVLTEFHPWLKENCFTADPRLLDAAKRYTGKKKSILKMARVQCHWHIIFQFFLYFIPFTVFELIKMYWLPFLIL